MREDNLSRDGVTRPLGMSLQDGLGFESRTNVLTLRPEMIPSPGHELVLEHRVTLFETDLPPQHMWSPQSGKHYQVLWTRTFREMVK